MTFAKTPLFKIGSTSALLFSTFSALATNGMSLEGYGPKSTAMGGTAQANDVGIGAMMNNPAMLGYDMKTGESFQMMAGFLKPTVTSKSEVGQTDAGGLFFMPGFGYFTKDAGITRGIGVIPQGGDGNRLWQG